MAPKVSVITPTFNRRHTLERTINSVLSQSYTDFEYFIIDDGSKDGTEEFVMDLINSRRDVRITYHKHAKNAGQNAALNTGLNMATGEMVAFLDSDDEWVPTMLEKQLKNFEAQKDIDCSYTWSGRLKGGKIVPIRKYSLQGNIYREALEQGYISGPITLMVRRECLISLGGFNNEFTVCQDDDLCFQLAKKYKFGLVKEPLAIIYEDAGNQTIKNARIYADGWTRLFTKYQNDILELCGSTVLANHWIKCSKLYLKSKDFQMAKSMAQRSLTLHFSWIGILLQLATSLPPSSLSFLIQIRKAIKKAIIQRHLLPVWGIIAAILLCSCTAPEGYPVAHFSILPKPASFELTQGKLDLEDVADISISDSSLYTTGMHLKEWLEMRGLESTVSLGNKKAQIFLRKSASDSTTEGYMLVVDSIKVEMESSSNAGIINGVSTFKQLVNLGINNPFMKMLGRSDRLRISTCRILDYPAFAWRGVLLDASRHFFSVDEVKKFLELMHRYKLNVFHWHLTDDQGWRIEIRKYPRLTNHGSIRKQTMRGHHSGPKPYEYDGQKYGGFYTQEDIKNVVAFASQRGITIVPEIEMPGHAMAALSAYPELGCTGGPYEVGTYWGVYDDIYCAGKEQVYVFLADVLEEVSLLFPGSYVHLGGDEVPKNKWEGCANCRKKMKSEKLANVLDLQSYFIERIRNELETRNRRAICWEEVLESNLDSRILITSWKDGSAAREAIKRGNKAILTPQDTLYFNKIDGDLYEPIAKVYSYYPVKNRNDSHEIHGVLGAQACIWTEYISDYETVEYAALPRIAAMAEVLWSPSEVRHWNEFKGRLDLELDRLERAGVNFWDPRQP